MKKIMKTLNNKSNNRLTIENDNTYFAYIIEHDVCYMVCFDRNYPKKLAFKYLDELQKEFDTQFGVDVEKAKRPYAFIAFGNQKKIEITKHVMGFDFKNK